MSFLQDSVLLRRRFPDHAIWGDPLFATPEYAEFAQRVVIGLDGGEEPHLTQIEKANPLVASELQTLGRTVASAEASLRLEITRQQRSIVTALEELRVQRQFVGRGLNRRLYSMTGPMNGSRRLNHDLMPPGWLSPPLLGPDLV